jgi:hypothetical protein
MLPLLNSIFIIAQATQESSVPYIHSILSMFADGLSSSEWSDRKGAAEAIRTILESMQEVISPSKAQIQQLLEEHKFDKVSVSMKWHNSLLSTSL